MNGTIEHADPFLRFAKHVREGMESWVKAGEILVEIVGEFGVDAAFSKIQDRISIPESALRGFLRLGRREIVPELLVDRAPWTEGVALLPYGEQREVIVQGKVRVARPRLPWIEVPLGNLTRKQCGLVFSAKGVRSPEEQARILATEDTQKRHGKRFAITVKKDEGEKEAERILDDEDDEDDGWEEEEEEEEEDSTPITKGPVESHLTAAQAHILKVREIIGSDHPVDDFITSTLLAIGKLRFALRNQERDD